MRKLFVQYRHDGDKDVANPVKETTVEGSEETKPETEATPAEGAE